MILETDGTISVIATSEDAPPPARNAVYETVKRNPEGDAWSLEDSSGAL